MSGNLTEQFTLAGRHARSRVLFGPHETNLGDGRALSPGHVAYYERRARGGAGVVVTEVASVHGSDWPYERAPLAAECGPGWRDVVAACRPHGTLVLAGLGHTGLQGSSAWSQSALWAPSRFPDPVSRELPMEMEQPEIAALVLGFREAARVAVAADVDGIELDAGVSSLLRQFHSGITNLRGDEYGTDRLRLTREVIAAVRAELGPDRILSLRLSCDEMAPWAGVTPEQAAGQVRELADFVDVLVVVRGGPFTVHAYRPDAHTAPGFNVELCREMRAAADGRVPVVLQGSVVGADQAQWALDDGVADLVEMTRAQIADPDLVLAVHDGSRPRPCVLCNQTCLVRDPRNPIVTCIGNPSAGHETVDREITPIEHPASALVVGAGPAGLEAARVLALRGFQVTLSEKGVGLGGMLRTAAAGTGRERLSLLAGWLEAECRRLGVRIRTSCEVDAAALDVARGAGTLVVSATGSSPRPAPCPVGAGVQSLGAAAVLSGASLESGPVLVLDPAGGPVAVSVALWLAERGREVAIVTADQLIGSRLGPTGDLVDANSRVQRAGVTRYLASVAVSAGAGEALLENRFTGVRTRVPCAVLVSCAHPLPNEELVIEGARVVRVGDCVAPRTALEAVREGHLAALSAVPTSSAGSAVPTSSKGPAAPRRRFTPVDG
ncbi:mycofactocin system FadH/OYE family oxidoreductase 1 [Rhodococcus sp. ABRD24]|uniref:mycofactocin system FadH/OYE family oxidoreductase 1 n=1 Tax=Rhodococcus sp. ABRD24 TaxID=2507582 RepID=UPI00103ABC94|nr:mycofactocin system FadH/OYE family oxidoreductase 1 [Rhodococcus sp. ABRD24]QBJ95615.1 mycofactocin system FadH/OYE family oxidoreductase 1 [Rhodococcus sp. ABRD24]